MYSHIERGSRNTPDYRIYFRDEDGPISPTHDIPLWYSEENKIFNIIIEIPRWTNAKFESRMNERLNPIMHTIQNGNIRYNPNVFPHHGGMWNYGAFPQTWQNPDILDEETLKCGDGDPVDALEIGYKVGKVGEVRRVKVLGAIALIDQGETDWKVFTIDVSDPISEHLKCIEDLDKHYCGLYDATIHWFKVYKTQQGKPENNFAFGGKPKDRKHAIEVIESAHKQWKHLIFGNTPNTKIDCTNTTIKGSPFKINTHLAEEIVSKSPLPGPAQAVSPSVNNWFFYELSKKKRKIVNNP